MMAKRNFPLALALVTLAFVAWALPAAGKPPLVPFPEDARESQAAEAKPLRPQPPKSNFEPRLRVPAVKQAERLKPADAGSSRQPQPLRDADAANATAATDTIKEAFVLVFISFTPGIIFFFAGF